MKWIRWLFLIFLFSASGQTKRQVDSLNGIPFETRIAKAATLDKAYLKNASDARKIGYKIGEAMSYSNLALVYNYKGKYSLSVGNSLKAIRLFESVGDKAKAAREYGELGYAMKRRNLPKAQFYMVKAKNLAESLRDTTSLLSIYNNYGVIKEMQDDLDSALFFYRKGLLIKEAKHDSTGISFSLNNIAGVYAMQGRFGDAEPMFEKALQMRIAKKDSAGIAENYSCSGDLYSAEKKYGKALENYRKSLEIALRNKYFHLVQYDYQNMSQIQEAMGDETGAFESYKKYTQFKDSLISRETNAKIAELEVEFETNEKEKQLLAEKSESQRKSNVLVLVSVLAFFIALTGFLIYRQQRLKNRQLLQEHVLKSAIAHIENQQQLQEQRLGISRDLHDNIGAQLTFIISSVDNLKYAFDLKDPALDKRLDTISDFTKDTIVELRDTIWAMTSGDITLEDVFSRISNFIEKAGESAQRMVFRFSMDETLKPFRLSSVTGMNLYRSVQEAVHNAIKYSNASSVKLVVFQSGETILIEISDDGIGFENDRVPSGNGLSNMEKRMKDAGGRFEILSEVGKGTTIRLYITKRS